MQSMVLSSSCDMNWASPLITSDGLGGFCASFVAINRADLSSMTGHFQQFREAIFYVSECPLEA